MCRCIGEYISLEPFYFVSLTSSCSFIPLGKKGLTNYPYQVSEYTVRFSCRRLVCRWLQHCLVRRLGLVGRAERCSDQTQVKQGSNEVTYLRTPAIRFCNTSPVFLVPTAFWRHRSPSDTNRLVDWRQGFEDPLFFFACLGAVLCAVFSSCVWVKASYVSPSVWVNTKLLESDSRRPDSRGAKRQASGFGAPVMTQFVQPSAAAC